MVFDAAYFVSHVRPHHHGHASMVTERPPVAHCGQRPGHHLMVTEADTESKSVYCIMGKVQRELSSWT